MEFKIRDTSWFKRRPPTKEIQPVTVTMSGLELTNDHMCEMMATYDDGNIYKLSARVNQNPITGKWTVHGINHTGLSTLVDIVE